MSGETPIDIDGGKEAAQPLAPIIVKKITIEEGGHHGGAWKVAYADFVTAMMAFFLLLWLLGATTEDQRKGIADYFAPTLVKMRQQSAGADGMLGGSSITDVDNYPNQQGQTGNQAITVPRATKGGPQKDGGASVEATDAKRAIIQKRIIERLQQSERLKRLIKQVRVVRTPEGVRIDLVDDADFSMFALGTTVLAPEARELLGVVSDALKDSPEELIIRGHTDGLPWRSRARANNWSLSAGRAEATRQEFIRQGISQRRFARIEGVADRELLVRDDPTDPRNRRMSVLVVS
ncbi:flagellar motor protein MotB [Erythrobacter sp. W53]|uniref:flagellar motor protein MotB n=1 Tax=Erythrobacteraceae TaxID=335929 RepID=UPI0036D2BAB6